MGRLDRLVNHLVGSVICIAFALAVGVGIGSDALGQEGIADASEVDRNADDFVDFHDFTLLARHWAPEGSHAGAIVGFDNLAVMASHWLEQTAPVVAIQWLGHASVKVWSGNQVVYVDPQNLSTAPHDATLVLVTHSHGDHYSLSDIARVSGDDTAFIAPPDVVNAHGGGLPLGPGETIDLGPLRIIGVPAYNLTRINHPKANNWLGYIIEIGSKRIYCAGDTDVTEEMKALEDIDVAFLPAGGTYTATALEAAGATKYITPRLAIPYHWGQVVGTRSDAERFARSAACNAKAMTRDEILSSREWGAEFSLASHWPLNESQGEVAVDVAGSADGVLLGDPLWQPAGRARGGALALNGEGDHVQVPFVVNPSEGPFSVFAWVRGGAPGQILISQAGQVNWLAVDASTGALGTELRGAGRRSGQLWSQTVIVGDSWRRVGLVWNGTERILYVDDVEVARDAQGSLGGSDDGLYFGAGAGLTPGAFWSGQIDDVRIYLRAITP